LIKQTWAKGNSPGMGGKLNLKPEKWKPLLGHFKGLRVRKLPNPNRVAALSATLPAKGPI